METIQIEKTLKEEEKIPKPSRQKEVELLMMQLKGEQEEIDEHFKVIDTWIVSLEQITKKLKQQKIDEMVSIPAAQKAAALESNLLEIAFQENSGFNTDFGKVSFRKSYLKRNWSIDELDTACALDPYIKEKIWQFRDIKQVKASASVELFP